MASDEWLALVHGWRLCYKHWTQPTAEGNAWLNWTNTIHSIILSAWSHRERSFVYLTFSSAIQFCNDNLQRGLLQSVSYCILSISSHTLLLLYTLHYSIIIQLASYSLFTSKIYSYQFSLLNVSNSVSIVQTLPNITYNWLLPEKPVNGLIKTL